MICVYICVHVHIPRQDLLHDQQKNYMIQLQYFNMYTTKKT